MRPSILVHALAAVTLCLATGGAMGQSLDKQEPGLWEIRMSQGSPVAALMQGMQAALSNMPAAQREQIEQMMQGSGVSLSEPTVVRQCLTRETAARGFEPYAHDTEMKCRTTSRKISGDKGQFSFSCQNGDDKWKGQGRIWDATSKSYKSEMKMEGTVQGQSIKMDMAHDARWLGEDCQGIKPVLP